MIFCWLVLIGCIANAEEPVSEADIAAILQNLPTIAQARQKAEHAYKPYWQARIRFSEAERRVRRLLKQGSDALPALELAEVEEKRARTHRDTMATRHHAAEKRLYYTIRYRLGDGEAMAAAWATWEAWKEEYMRNGAWHMGPR